MLRISAIAILMTMLCVSVSARVYRVAEMNADQIRALDRSKTVVLMPGGILEQHGPYLPSYSDGYMNEWLTGELAEAIVARPGWSVLIFPTIPLGQSGANDIGHIPVFPGTYAVRSSTLRSVFMDLASELGEQGFKWIFVIHNHGSPEHNLMLDQAGDYFRDVYKGKMVNLAGMLAKPSRPQPDISAEGRKEDGIFQVHAGVSETSRIMFLRPDLVPMTFLNAKPYTANSMAEAVTHGRSRDWPGYIGSPRLATASYGAQEMRFAADENNALALSILNGLDERTIPRLSVLGYQDKATVEVLSDAAKHWSGIERRQNDWLRSKGIK
jgi:creatinine amidohydrolase